MDTYGTPGEGATRLSFAQKIIASGLSVVLAFGLSPFGQVPSQAYADEGSSAVATQSLQTQAELSGLIEIIPSKTITYKGASYYNSEGTTTIDTLTDNEIKAYFTSDIGDFKKGAQITLKNSTYVSKVEYQDANGKAVTKIADVGTYKIVVTGAGLYAGTTVTETFTVNPLSIVNNSSVSINGNSSTWLNTTYAGKNWPTAPQATYTYTADDQQTATVNIPLTTTPATIKNFSSNVAVSATASGNFTGTVNGRAYVNRASAWNTTVATVAGLDTTTNTFPNQKFGETTDPVTTVTYYNDKIAGPLGATEQPDTLTRGTDYSVTYQPTSNVNKEDGTAKDSTKVSSTAPTAVGEYLVTLSAAGNNFSTTDTIRATYSIVDTNVVPVSKGAAVTVNGTYANGVAVTADAKNVKLYDKDGTDITSQLGTITLDSAYMKWTPELEQTWISDPGDTTYAAYYATYGAIGYENKDTAIVGTNSEDEDTYGKPLGVGDYGVRVLVNGASTNIYAKFTVNPAVLSKGTAKGDIYVDTTGSKNNTYGTATSSLAAPALSIRTVAATSADATPATSDLSAIASSNYDIEYRLNGVKVEANSYGVYDAGTYDAYITFKNNLEGSAAITEVGALVVKPASIGTLITDVTFANGMYSGSGLDAKTSSMTLSEAFTSLGYTQDALKLGTDYEFAYGMGASGVPAANGKPLAPATYSITVKGKGNFGGSMVAVDDYTVAPLDISTDFTTIQYQQADGTWADEYRAMYVSGTTYEPAVRLVVKDGSDVVATIDSSLYTKSYANNQAAGVANVTLTSVSGNDYVQASAVKTGTFYLTTASLADDSTLTLGSKSVTYDPTKTDVTPSITVTSTSKGVLPSNYYTYSVTDANGKAVTAVTEVGTYTVKVTGGENGYYAGELTDTFEVTALELKQSDVFDNAVDSTTDEAKNLTGKLKITVATRSYTGEAQTGVQKVEYSPYGFNSSGVPLDANGTAITADVTTTPVVTLFDIEATENESCAVTDNEQTAVGSYAASLAFAGNYTGTVTQDWKIAAAAGNSFSFYLDGLFDSSNTSTSKNDKNTYSKSFDGTAWEPKVTIFDANGDDVTADVVHTVIYENNVDAGTATVHVIATGNYQFSKDLTFTIAAIDFAKAYEAGDITVTFDPASLEYTGSALSPAPIIEYTASDKAVYTFVPGTDFIVGYDGDRTNVGDKANAVILVKSKNFGYSTTSAPSVTVPFEITKATQTITASDKSVTVAKTVALDASSDKGSALTYKSSDEKIATVDANGTVTGVAAGSVTITITAAGSNNIAEATQDITVTVGKGANTLSIAKASRTAKKVSKKKATVVGAKVANAGQGAVTWTKVKVNKNAKKFTVNKTTGKITVKKGTKAGTYKVTVKATAKGDANYKSTSKTAVVTIKVKK